MGTKSAALADPELVIFLLNRVRRDPRLKPLALAFTSGDERKAAAIDIALRNPIYLSAQKAQDILRWANLVDEWQTFKAAPARTNGEELSIQYNCQRFGQVESRSLEQFTRDGVDPLDVARQLVEIDADLFSMFSNDDWIGTPEDWRDVMTFEPDCWRAFAAPDGRVLGYWMFLNPKREKFLEACVGGYPEDEITIETLDKIDPSRQANIYGPGLYVRKDIQNWDRSVLGSHLLISFLSHVKRLERKGIVFENICIPVCSEEGRKLAEDRFGLERMPEDINKIYANKMGWKILTFKRKSFPAIYFSALDDDIRARAGLA